MDPGEDIDEESNPLLGYRERFVKDWPEPARPDDADEVFADGWRHSALDSVAIGGVQPTLLEPLAPEERELFEELAAERRHHAGFLLEREGTDAVTGAAGPLARRTVSVGGVIDYARCPKRFYWTAVRPLPRFSGPAARIGTEVHRWIERRRSVRRCCSRSTRRPTSRARSWPASRARSSACGRRSWAAGSPTSPRSTPSGRSCFGSRLHGGRADRRRLRRARRRVGGGGLEDRSPPRRRRPARALQLDLYGSRASSLGEASRDVTLTYLYLASAKEVSHPMEDPDVVKARVVDALRSIDAGA